MRNKSLCDKCKDRVVGTLGKSYQTKKNDTWNCTITIDCKSDMIKVNDVCDTIIDETEYNDLVKRAATEVRAWMNERCPFKFEQMMFTQPVDEYDVGRPT